MESSANLRKNFPILNAKNQRVVYSVVQKRGTANFIRSPEEFSQTTEEKGIFSPATDE
jgi:hypothetical protein